MSKKGQKVDTKRNLLMKGEDMEYGIITKKLGNARFAIRLNLQNKDIIGRLCGKFRQKSKKRDNWVDIDSVVLVGMRDFQDNIVDIIHVYTHDEAKELKKNGEIVIDDERTHDTNDDTEDVFNFEDL